MLGRSIPPPRTWRLFQGPKKALEVWSQSLRQKASSTSPSDELLARIKDDVASLPEGLGKEVEAAFQEWWPLRPRLRQSLELLVVQPDGRRQKASYHHRVVRIGRSPSCNLQLQHDTVSSEHCEIRIDEDRLWIVDLSSFNGTRVNGYALTAFEPRPLMTGDQVEIVPFRVVAGRLQNDPDEQQVSLSCERLKAVQGEQPHLQLARPDDLWLRTRYDSWEAFFLVPSTWLPVAYKALGIPAPSPSSGSFGGPVDLSLTNFLLSRITSAVQERTGLSAQGSSLLTAAAVSEILDQRQGPWGTAQLELTLGDHRSEIWALWDMAEESPRRQAERAWTEAIPFQVAVCAGRLRLAAEDLKVIDPGDTLVPDQWYADMWVDPQDQRLGPVELRLQHWSRRAQLLFEKGFFRLEVEGDWRRAPQGGFMESEATPADADMSHAEEQDSTASFRISDELELLLAFELERITVPLKELSSWSEGSTITLQKTPEDPVSIVLRQAGQERLLGHGRVVVVEDRLGIQIEKWLVEKEANEDPGESSSGD